MDNSWGRTTAPGRCGSCSCRIWLRAEDPFNRLQAGTAVPQEMEPALVLLRGRKLCQFLMRLIEQLRVAIGVGPEREEVRVGVGCLRELVLASQGAAQVEPGKRDLLRQRIDERAAEHGAKLGFGVGGVVQIQVGESTKIVHVEPDGGELAGRLKVGDGFRRAVGGVRNLGTQPGNVELVPEGCGGMLRRFQPGQYPG
jgi:hypothetical protein